MLSIAVLTAIVVGVLLWSFVQRLERVALGYVAIVELSGTISYGDGGLLGGTTITPSNFKYYVDRIVGDPAAKAVVLVVNSPGGSAAASEEIYQLMKRLADSRIVVVYTPETLASGGYYISLPAHKIMASPHALVGSIGSIMVLYRVDELLNKLGINVTVIKSGRFKDIGSATRMPTEEEVGILKSIVDKTAQIFIDRVKEHKNVSYDVFTAKIYIGADAVRVGLVDSVGTLDDAVELAKKLAGMPPHAPGIRIEKPRGLLELLLGRSTRMEGVDIFGGAVPLEFVNKVLYLWIPGG